MSILFEVAFIVIVYLLNCIIFYRLMVRYQGMRFVLMLLLLIGLSYIILFPFSDLVSFFLKKAEIPIKLSPDDMITTYNIYNICFFIPLVAIFAALIKKRYNRQK